jgi:hypothetical protein
MTWLLLDLAHLEFVIVNIYIHDMYMYVIVVILNLAKSQH